ncbi:hypothetical protein EL26_13765 [Tumebacillus flagellatus]|uniref:Uncharacterized protein n=1 Tax=Tumebacillus flagellatus TaxID=1157490 RepID=A0A074LSM6_9BACL|nr:hypothetical protein EL26_13765 [Tumebacillus flagellatus]
MVCEVIFAATVPSLLEREFKRTVLVAKQEWLRGVFADLESGKLALHEKWLREMSSKLDVPEKGKSLLGRIE